MRSFVLLAAIVLMAAPLAACNRQPANKQQSVPTMQTGERGRNGGLRNLCGDDLQKFCSQQRGRERRTCLQSHLNELSDQCKNALEGRGRVRVRRWMRFRPH